LKFKCSCGRFSQKAAKLPHSWILRVPWNAEIGDALRENYGGVDFPFGEKQWVGKSSLNMGMRVAVQNAAKNFHKALAGEKLVVSPENSAFLFMRRMADPEGPQLQIFISGTVSFFYIGLAKNALALGPSHQDLWGYMKMQWMRSQCDMVFQIRQKLKYIQRLHSLLREIEENGNREFADPFGNSYQLVSFPGMVEGETAAPEHGVIPDSPMVVKLRNYDVVLDEDASDVSFSEARMQARYAFHESFAGLSRWVEDDPMSKVHERCAEVLGTPERGIWATLDPAGHRWGYRLRLIQRDIDAVVLENF